eukprot:gnl/TRDRNA2_/TRDRNA2_139931_c1_seq3.p1 gnl/TRDRNA2_/TRDRNA2_139931_c1~~gnl/TRDRNA2_/TRDRNA2_139931_c1_seq3.p1  ORF type:complete len:114 (-),score=25.54 gnl/TRDRNA2_/TRDRNA2_139931_c1_seq3:70-411(-)
MMAKRNAIKTAIKQALGSFKDIRNAITVGDSWVEHDALKDLVWCHPELNDLGTVCKTVKFMDDPSVEELGNQLSILSSWLRKLAKHPEDVDTTVGDEIDAIEHVGASQSPWCN